MIKTISNKEQQAKYLSLLGEYLSSEVLGQIKPDFRECYHCANEGLRMTAVAVPFREVEKIRRKASGFSPETAEFMTPEYDKHAKVYVCPNGHTTEETRPKEADVVLAQINRMYQTKETVDSKTKTN